MRLPVIVSGAQTGVDRGALDAAIEMGVPHKGWVPLGRLSEDGPVDKRYRLTETPSADWLTRTDWNVRDSDATLLIVPDDALSGGTKRTAGFADSYGKPWFAVAPDDSGTCIRRIPDIMWWLEYYKVGVLNVAGPRLSKWKLGYAASYFTCTELIWKIREALDDEIPF